MRRAILTLAATTLGLAACHPVEHRNAAAHLLDHGSFSVADRLTCPDEVGQLSRTDQAADGQRCDYAGPGSEEVTLTRMSLDGRTPTVALAGLETRLKTSTGLQSVPADRGLDVSADHGDGDGDDHAHVNLPGLHIDAGNDKANIRVLGMTIKADGQDAEVHTGWGPVKNTVIHANDAGAEVRAGDVGANGADLVYVLSGKPTALGYRALGYIARGPVAGPLVVAQFKAKGRDENHDWKANGLEKLMKINVQG